MGPTAPVPVEAKVLLPSVAARSGWASASPLEDATATDSGRRNGKKVAAPAPLTTTIKEAASAFLANKRIAVTGVSRTAKGHGRNTVYTRLRDRGYEVFAVYPSADEVAGDRCYHSLIDIPGGVDAVVIATRPEAAEATIQECAELGIKQTWMHRPFGEGSVCDDATVYGREHGNTVIDGGCPLMFEPTADFAHKIMRFVFTRSGNVPKTV